MKLRKPIQHANARRFRAEDGLSLKEIARRVGVAPSTVRGWVADIVLAQQAALDLDTKRSRRSPGDAAALRTSDVARASRLEWQEQGRAKARDAEPLHLKGCMLYWAEGTKSKNVVGMTNLDPDLLRTFLSFSRVYFDAPDSDWRLTLTYYDSNGLTQEEIENYWLTTLGLPSECLGNKHHVKTSVASKETSKVIRPYGVASIRLSSTAVVQHIFGAIQEYAGADKPEWLA